MKPFKSKHNLLAMNGILRKMKKGRLIIYIASSGGRNRRALDSGKVPVAPFDQKMIDAFRLLGNNSK